jgi:hypothetical protein
MSLVGGTANCIRDDYHAVAEVDGCKDSRKDANIGLRARHDDSVRLPFLQMSEKVGPRKCRITGLIDDDGGRALSCQRGEQFEKSWI